MIVILYGETPIVCVLLTGGRKMLLVLVLVVWELIGVMVFVALY